MHTIISVNYCKSIINIYYGSIHVSGIFSMLVECVKPLFLLHFDYQNYTYTCTLIIVHYN